jgi:four helix bundle protein
MGSGATRFTELRAWQACTAYKRAVLGLCREGTLARDLKLRGQLEDSVCGPPDHLAEGFGRFSPPDFARYTVMARSSLMESQNQLITAVDKGHITEAQRVEYNALAEAAIQETTGLMEYLQSPDALRNARRARERRDEKRARREPRPHRSKRNTDRDEP